MSVSGLPGVPYSFRAQRGSVANVAHAAFQQRLQQRFKMHPQRHREQCRRHVLERAQRRACQPSQPCQPSLPYLPSGGRGAACSKCSATKLPRSAADSCIPQRRTISR